MIRRKKKEKVFCIGRNKTGTTSIEFVLKEFGYNMGNQGKAELLVHDYAKGNWKPIIKYCKSAEAFQDAPFSWPNTWLILHEHFPDAKFILTTRDSEKWYNSITKFHAKGFSKNNHPPTKSDLINATYRYKGFMWDANRAVWKTDEENVYNKKNMIDNFERHNKDVKHFFIGKNNFLEIDVSDEYSYIELCDFLGKEPMHKDFPHLNKT